MTSRSSCGLSLSSSAARRRLAVRLQLLVSRPIRHEIEAFQHPDGQATWNKQQRSSRRSPHSRPHNAHSDTAKSARIGAANTQARLNRWDRLTRPMGCAGTGLARMNRGTHERTRVRTSRRTRTATKRAATRRSPELRRYTQPPCQPGRLTDKLSGGQATTFRREAKEVELPRDVTKHLRTKSNHVRGTTTVGRPTSAAG